MIFLGGKESVALTDQSANLLSTKNSPFARNGYLTEWQHFPRTAGRSRYGILVVSNVVGRSLGTGKVTKTLVVFIVHLPL